MDTLDNMDPQATPVNNEAQEANENPTANEETQAANNEPQREDFSIFSREELVERFQKILDSDEVAKVRGVVSDIKRAFFAKTKQEQAEVATDTEPVEAVIETVESEETVEQPQSEAKEEKTVIDVIFDKFQELDKAFRAKLAVELGAIEAEREKNFVAKMDIVEKLEALCQEGDLTKSIPEYSRLRKEFYNIGSVPRTKQEELLSRFRAANNKLKTFADLYYKTRNEEYKKNEEQKEALINELEALEGQENPQEAFNTLRELRTRWNEVGAVSREKFAELKERFQTAADKVYGKYKEYAKEQQAKTREMNARFKAERNKNLEQKRALCEEAEKLQDSNEWNATSSKLAELMKQWKAIGVVASHQSDALWKRFHEANEKFFQRRNEARKGKPEEIENLAKKREVIEKINNYESTGDAAADRAALKALMDEFNAIGFVPYREKDAIKDDFRKACDKQFGNLRSAAGAMATNEAITQGRGDAERQKLVKKYEALKSELTTYENNIGFLSASSKNGSSLIVSMEEKVANLRRQLEELVDRIALIDKANDENNNAE